MHADGIFYLSTHFCAVLELVVVADLTEATRQRPTFDTDAILSVNDYGAGVSHLEVLRYDTRCYFNVRSKADMSRLNLPHGDDN